MQKITFSLKIIICIALLVFLSTFYGFRSVDEDTLFLQKKLIEYYDFSQEGLGVKRFELNVTNSGFCRYKRYFNNGKVEYFSFNLSRFKDIDYYGTSVSGKLYIKTKGDDVIVQTYNDGKGNVDSMGTCMVVPLKNIEPSELNDMAYRFEKIRKQLNRDTR